MTGQLRKTVTHIEKGPSGARFLNEDGNEVGGPFGLKVEESSAKPPRKLPWGIGALRDLSCLAFLAALLHFLELQSGGAHGAGVWCAATLFAGAILGAAAGIWAALERIANSLDAPHPAATRSLFRKILGVD